MEVTVSKKILGIGLTIAGAALLFIPGIGTALGLGAISLGAGLGSIAVASLIGVGLEIAGSFLLGPSKPKLSSELLKSQSDRLTATLIPTDPRKISFGGPTALGNDVRYQVFSGTNQEYLDMVVCHASHKIQSIDELWLDNELAWNGTVQGRYVGYLTVTPITEGTSSNGIAIDANWTSSCTLTGCAYSHVRFKLSGNSDKVSSPFASGVTSRMTWRGKGAKVYDPRLDSTVTGGSGSQRADDQTTWAWDDNASRNPALQELFYELGWKIGGKLAVGKGVPPARIDLASYAVAANACDESVTLNGGGTEPRYRSDGVVSEGDDPGSVRDNLCATMNAVLRDAGGKLALTVIHNDLATPVTPSGRTAFDASDILGEMQWQQTPDLSSTFNVVRGRKIDPSNAALYQPVDFPEVSIVSNDGIDRIDSVDYPFVQSNGQAQRLAKQRLERNQYQGRLTFTGKPSFWGLNVGDVFPLSHPALGWSSKLFRCAGQKISRTGQTDIVAVEENAAIYQWDNDERPAVTPGTPTVYDPLNDPLIGSGAPGDSNRVRLSLFEAGTLGWDLYDATASSLALAIGTSGGLTYAHATGNFTANGQECSIGSDGPAHNGYFFPVTAGERLYVGGLVGSVMPNSACTVDLVIIEYDSAGAVVTGDTIWTGNGSDSFPTLRSGFITVGSGVVFGQLRLHATNNALGITGAFELLLAQPIVCGAGVNQTTLPAFTPGPSNEGGAQVNRWIANPTQRLSFRYDYTGSAKSGEFPRDITFGLSTPAGVLDNAVVWTYQVLTGTVNGFTSASGSQGMGIADGIGFLTVSSLGSSEAKVQVTAVFRNQPYTLTVTLYKDVDGAPVSGGGGGGGGGATGTIATGHPTGTINSTSFVDNTGAITGTMPSGSTTANIAVDASAMPDSGTSGNWTVECKVMRDISGTPTQIGSTQSASSDWFAPDVSGDSADFLFSISDTGLTGGSSYTWRVYLRLTSGTRTHYITGTVSITA